MEEIAIFLCAARLFVVWHNSHFWAPVLRQPFYTETLKTDPEPGSETTKETPTNSAYARLDFLRPMPGHGHELRLRQMTPLLQPSQFVHAFFEKNGSAIRSMQELSTRKNTYSGRAPIRHSKNTLLVFCAKAACARKFVRDVLPIRSNSHFC